MLKVFELDLSKSEYRADHPVAKGDFLLPKDEETDILGRSKSAGRDPRAAEPQEEKHEEISVLTGMEEIKAFTAPAQRGYCSSSCPLTPARSLPWEHWQQHCLEGYTGELSSKPRWFYYPQQSAVGICLLCSQLTI